jgi:hypothetical protein
MHVSVLEAPLSELESSARVLGLFAGSNITLRVI